MLAVVVITSSVLAACSSEPMITDRDVLVSQNRGQLLQMYDQMKTDLATVKPSSERATNLRKYISVVGEKVADDKEAVILNDLKRDLELHDIATLEKAKADSVEIKGYNEKVYLGLVLQLDTTISKKMEEISSKQKTFNQLTIKASKEKVTLLDEVALIYGGEKGEAVKAQKQSYIDGLFVSAQKEMQKKRFEDVLVYLDQLDIVSPEYPGVQDMRYALIAAEYQQQFWDALGSGDQNKSFMTLTKLNEIPGYFEKNPDVKGIAVELSAVFMDEGNKRMAGSSVIGAYDAYSKANFIDLALQKEQSNKIYSEQELKFIAFVEKRLQQYVSSSDFVPAYGYLSILQELQANNANIGMYAKHINDAMIGYAKIKLVPAYLTDNKGNRELSREVIYQVKTRLPDVLSAQVKFVERALTSADYTRTKVNQKVNPASYYFLTGEIIDTHIKTNQKETVTTENVLIGSKTVENPTYVVWANLKKREQKKKPQPPMTIQMPVKQDVQISKTVVNKNAELQVTYRFAVASGKVAFADAIDEKIEIFDEEIAGIEVGEFKQEAKVLDLPTDEVLYQRMANSAADEMLASLKENLDSFERLYLKNAESAAVKRSDNSAFSNYAYYNVLLDSRGKKDAELLKKVRHHAIRWK